MGSEKSIGTILKEKRESKGLTLMDIERGTSIRSRYIQAVENDEYEKTPGGVFLKGIIRNYGDFLGLDVWLCCSATRERLQARQMRRPSATVSVRLKMSA